MTERELEHLKELPVPPPRDAAKRAAIGAALTAFDAREKSQADDGQGNVVPLRLTETSRPKRSFLMQMSSRQSQALAASLAALIVAAPIAFQHYGRSGLPIEISALKTEVPPAQPAMPSVADARPQFSAGDEQRLKLALGEKQKAETGRAAPAPQEPTALAAQTVTPSVDQLGVADARRVDGEALSKGDDAKPQIAAPVSPAAQIARKELGLPGAGSGSQASALAVRPDGLGAVGGYSGLGTYTGGQPQQPQATDNTAAPAPADEKVEAIAPPAPPSPQPSAAMVAPGLTGLDGSTIANGDGTRLRNFAGKPVTDALSNVPLVHGPAGVARSDILKQNETVWTGDADAPVMLDREENRDKFDAREINPVKQVATEPVSTFSIDVDTASYSFVRRALNSGHLPPKDAVRVEEMINYFPYTYPAPETAETPFKPTVTVLPTPWNPNTKLVHVAIKGYDLKSAERPRANLVLLMDVSGSMQPEDRLPLVKTAFRLLVDQLKPDDTVGIVTYASGSGIALEPTKVSDKNKILNAIDKLGAGGSTAGAEGIQDAYRLAEANFDKSAVNRIILATDGDFNVGITDQNELKGFIERKRQSGIFLSILGVGQGNHNDALMQTLAQNGNGTAAYADTLNEARKVLVDESSSTLFTIAKDVKVQIEWNPARVAEYRLIGYESRALRREDFNNDRVDAGDIGSGHTVTAIYEVTPAGSPQLADDLRYGKATAAKLPAKAPASEAEADSAKTGEFGFLKLRYKKPNEDVSQLVTVPLTDALVKASVAEVATEARFSIAVAAYGQLVKGEPYTQSYSFDDVLALAQSARGDDPFGYRAEFLNLVRLAKSARP